MKQKKKSHPHSFPAGGFSYMCIKGRCRYSLWASPRRSRSQPGSHSIRHIHRNRSHNPRPPLCPPGTGSAGTARQGTEGAGGWEGEAPAQEHADSLSVRGFLFCLILQVFFLACTAHSIASILRWVGFHERRDRSQGTVSPIFISYES